MNIQLGDFSYDPQSLVYIPIGLAALLVFRLVMDVLTSYDDNRELNRDNVAPSLARAGQYIGFTLALAGSVLSPGSGSFARNVGSFAVDAGVAIILMAVAALIFDAAILRNVDNSDALEAGNMAVGTVEAFSYVGLGMIMFSSFNGLASSIPEGILGSVVFGVLGTFVLMLNYLLMGSQLDQSIIKGDMPSAVRAGGVIAASSIALIPAIAGTSNGWAADLIGFVIFAALATGLVYLVSRVARIIVTPDSKQANMASNVVAASATAAVVIMYAAAA